METRFSVNRWNVASGFSWPLQETDLLNCSTEQYDHFRDLVVEGEESSKNFILLTKVPSLDGFISVSFVSMSMRRINLFYENCLIGCSKAVKKLKLDCIDLTHEWL